MGGGDTNPLGVLQCGRSPPGHLKHHSVISFTKYSAASYEPTNHKM